MDCASVLLSDCVWPFTTPTQPVYTFRQSQQSLKAEHHLLIAPPNSRGVSVFAPGHVHMQSIKTTEDIIINGVIKATKIIKKNTSAQVHIGMRMKI